MPHNIGWRSIKRIGSDRNFIGKVVGSLDFGSLNRLVPLGVHSLVKALSRRIWLLVRAPRLTAA